MSLQSPLELLIKSLSRLPGLGPRSGRRLALHLIKNKTRHLRPLIDLLHEVETSIKHCSICGHIDIQDPCSICGDARRDTKTLCVVADVADLWALERSASFRGYYHVLGGYLSAIEGIGPNQLNVPALIERIQKNNDLEEIIFALGATLEAQTTLFYLTDYIKEKFPHRPNLKLTTLAQGIPLGGELDYLDDGTLCTALGGRKKL